MSDFRVGRKLVSSPSILDDDIPIYHHSIIEVFYDYDIDNPAYDEILATVNPRMNEIQRQEIYDTLPVKITNYCETNFLNYFDVLTDLQETCQDILNAFNLSFIDLDHFPDEIPAENITVQQAKPQGLFLPINPVMIDIINNSLNKQARKLESKSAKKSKPKKEVVKKSIIKKSVKPKMTVVKKTIKKQI